MPRCPKYFANSPFTFTFLPKIDGFLPTAKVERTSPSFFKPTGMEVASVDSPGRTEERIVFVPLV